MEWKIYSSIVSHATLTRVIACMLKVLLVRSWMVLKLGIGSTPKPRDQIIWTVDWCVKEIRTIGWFYVMDLKNELMRTVKLNLCGPYPIPSNRTRLVWKVHDHRVRMLWSQKNNFFMDTFSWCFTNNIEMEESYLKKLKKNNILTSNFCNFNNTVTFLFISKHIIYSSEGMNTFNSHIYSTCMPHMSTFVWVSR